LIPESCGLDTNILVFLADEQAPWHEEARRAVNQLAMSRSDIVLPQQTLFEFWVVATRPAASNGLDWRVSRVRDAIDALRHEFSVLPETAAVVDVWLDLVAQHDLKGKRIHDAHLLATLQVSHIPALLTANPKDFFLSQGLRF
jgi:predicted nucleic acid-binding protein